MQNLDNYIIVYSNHFEFNGHILAFRKGFLFDISATIPQYLPMIENSGSKGWYITKNRKRKWLSKTIAKELAKERKPKEVNVSNLEWYAQIELDECFNLEKKIR